MPRLLSERAKDRVADRVIRVGGILVILVVVAIVVNIGWQAAPLFFGAEAGPVEAVADSLGVLAVGSDPRFDVTWRLTADGRVRFEGGPNLPPLELGNAATPIVAADHEIHGLLAALRSDGLLEVGEVRFRDRWDEQTRTLEARWRAAADPYALPAGREWAGVTANRDADGAVVAVAWTAKGHGEILEWDADDEAWATVAAPFPLDDVAGAAVAEDLGTVSVLGRDGGLRLVKVSPPAEIPVEGLDRPLAAARFLIGGGTLVAAGVDGSVSVVLQVSRVGVENVAPDAVEVARRTLAPGERMLVADDGIAQELSSRDDLLLSSAPPVARVARELPPLGGTPVVIAPSHRGRTFAVGAADGTIGLYHSTSGRRLLSDRWRPAPVAALTLAPKGDGAMAVVGGDVLRRTVDNPHPEISFRTLFLPVWYEGHPDPAWVWQSTGGSDAFEPKLSLWPLLFGTLKATLYAMLLSVPLALMAAVYVSQLAPHWLQTTVKPTLELMAGVPSVVVGFLAALWLAPRLEAALLSTLVGVALLPMAVVIALLVWRFLPPKWRRLLPAGSELALLLAASAALLAVVPDIARVLESAVFGGDVQRFLYTELGLRYDQRNSLVVGLGLGFAVIPVIFTIAEDACSSVPQSLVTASRALGATRWQTAVRLVVPAASPGLFAAVMLGLGRAVGETMIVLMAAGNTPLLDLSPFNGMRTMSAAIAVEIPEAPVAGTLFRVLFLTGTLLFAFTLVLTTAADLVGSHLRKRYARF